MVGNSTALAMESLFYALDTVPVLCCFLVFMIFHYGLMMPISDDEFKRSVMIIPVAVNTQDVESDNL